METDIRNKKQKNFEAEMGEEEEQLWSHAFMHY
jgi:hypothetical protein